MAARIVQKGGVVPTQRRSASSAPLRVFCEASRSSSQAIGEAVQRVGLGVASVAATGILILGSGPWSQVALADTEFDVYYGTAASASSYGGYGGNSSKKDSAEYTYEVPDTWKERNISKVEKGTNGTDSEFFNPKKRTEKTYLTFLAGFRQLPPIDMVLTNIALSDVNLQDLLASADNIDQKVRKVDDQVFYDFDIDSPLGRSLITVTCKNNKLYSHFVNFPSSEFEKDESLARHIHESFQTT